MVLTDFEKVTHLAGSGTVLALAWICQSAMP